MDLAIVDQGNPCNTVRHLHAVELDTNDAATHATRILDLDFVARDRVPGAAVAEHDFVARPCLGQTRIDYQRIPVHTESENGFEPGTVQPTRRTGIPGPAAAADMRCHRIDVGAGGWTWYTGSAGWLYRAGLEAILGFRVHGNTLVIEPCLPKTWPGYEIVFRRRGARNTITRYEITVENSHRVSRGVVSAELDGVEVAKGVARIPLVDDGRIHRVRVELG